MIERVLIVEDEEALQRSLKRKVERLLPSLKALHVAGSIQEASQALIGLNYDLIFLDINLPDGKGFSLLGSIADSKVDLPLVIITTAYEEFAIEAIRNNVVDYLLKPIDPDELAAALEKAKSMFEEKVKEETSDEVDDRIAVFTAERIEMIALSEIIRVEASNNYATLHLMEARKLLVSKTLKDVEQKLAHRGFYRVHQSHLVNLAHVKTLERHGVTMIILSDGSNVPVSNSFKAGFMETLRKRTF